MAVNKSKRGRPNKGSDRLNREAIVATAKTLIFEQQQAMSIRALAKHLHVDAMAIYHYFDNKAALLEAVTVSIIQGIYQPRPGSDWQTELLRLCHSYIRLLRNHPGLLPTLLSMTAAIEGPAQVFTSRFEQILQPLALPQKTRQACLQLLIDYLHGFALSLHYASDKSALSLADMDESLAFYLRALTLYKPQQKPATSTDQAIIRYAFHNSHLGPMAMAAGDQGICSIQFADDQASLLNLLTAEFPHAQLKLATTTLQPWMLALDAYLSGTSRRPDLPIDLRGTDFQTRVWQFLMTMAEGEVLSYSELASALKQPKASRAVASACARNRIAVLIPCHRILRSDGGLGGYRWGLERKQALLAMEQQQIRTC